MPPLLGSDYSGRHMYQQWPIYMRVGIQWPQPTPYKPIHISNPNETSKHSMEDMAMTTATMLLQWHQQHTQSSPWQVVLQMHYANMEYGN